MKHEGSPAPAPTDQPATDFCEPSENFALTSTTQDPGTSQPPARRPWWVGPPLFLVIALYVLPLAGSPTATNPNEVVRIELAVSIAFWAQLDLGATAAVYGLSEDVSIRDGRIYSDKAPGLSIVSAPVVWIVNPILGRAPSSDLPTYWPLRHALTLLMVALPTVGLAFLVGAAVPEVDPRQRTAFALIAALATPLWAYGTVYFGHASAALLVTLAWLLLLGPPDRITAIGVRRAAGGGAVAGLAVATEYPTALLVAVIFATLVARRSALPILAGATAGAFAGALPALIYHQVAFGAPWITGYSFKAASDFQAIIAHGVFGISWPSAEALWGILFGARRGIFFYCPLLLLTPLGLWWMVRSRGWRDAGPILAAIAAYVFFAAGFVDWTAGWCAAARHLVPIVPLAVVVALYAAKRLVKHRWGAMIVVMLIVVSGANAVLTIALTPFFPRVRRAAGPARAAVAGRRRRLFESPQLVAPDGADDCRGPHRRDRHCRIGLGWWSPGRRSKVVAAARLPGYRRRPRTDLDMAGVSAEWRDRIDAGPVAQASGTHRSGGPNRSIFHIGRDPCSRLISTLFGEGAVDQ